MREAATWTKATRKESKDKASGAWVYISGEKMRMALKDAGLDPNERNLIVKAYPTASNTKNKARVILVFARGEINGTKSVGDIAEPSAKVVGGEEGERNRDSCSDPEKG
jgi:hypothetical protein